MKKKKQVITKLILGEISSVDRPAQTPALATIIKKETEMSFPELVNQIQKSAGCGRNEALRKARELYPQEFESYQETGYQAEVELRKSLNTPLRKRSDFDDAVERMLIENPRMKRTAAMREVARQQPELFEAHQSAA